MNKAFKIAVILIFSLSVCFCLVGYAAISTSMTMRGSVHYETPREVFITDVALSSSSNGGKVNGTPSYYATTLSSEIDLSKNTGKVTLAVTVFNNTGVDQGYDATIADSAFYTNHGIKYTLSGISRPTAETNTTTGVTTVKDGTKIAPGAHHTFYVTFERNGNASLDSTVLSSVLQFIFKPYNEITPDENFVIIEGALGRFVEILNTPSMYTELDSELDDGMTLTNKPDSFGDFLVQATVNIILKGAKEYDYPTLGNVGDSLLSQDQGDVTYVTDIFTDSETNKNYLTLEVNNAKIDVKALIQGVDADGDGDYDIMMLYMTPTNIGGGDKTVTPVYLAFFNNTDGGWVQNGPLHTGSASACRYSTAMDQSSYNNNWLLNGLANNSFNPDTWKSVTGTSRNTLLDDLKESLGYTN